MKYCKLKGYLFNPARYDALSRLPLYYDKDGSPDLDDKSGGVEYFTITPLSDLPEPDTNNQPASSAINILTADYEQENDVQHGLPF